MTTTLLADGWGRSANSLARRILIAGAAGGLVDMVYFSTTVLINHGNPLSVFRSIAHFWPVGALAKGGLPVTLIGLATHFGLATIMAAGFALLLPALFAILRSSWLAGAVYGILLYLVMYLIVMPLRWPAIYPHFEGLSSMLDVMVHIAVGMTFAAILKKHRLAIT